MPATEIVGILIVLMIIASLIAVETSDLLSSIVCVGAVGFVLSIAFLVLGAPDIAITQVVVEVLCLLILIRATISRDLTTISGDREFVVTVAAAGLVLALAGAVVLSLAEFPPFGEPVMTRMVGTASESYLAAGLEETGSANIVTAIILDFRAYDTLGEATVLFCAVLGALTILRKRARVVPAAPAEEGDS